MCMRSGEGVQIQMVMAGEVMAARCSMPAYSHDSERHGMVMEGLSPAAAVLSGACARLQQDRGF